MGRVGGELHNTEALLLDSLDVPGFTVDGAGCRVVFKSTLHACCIMKCLTTLPNSSE